MYLITIRAIMLLFLLLCTISSHGQSRSFIAPLTTVQRTLPSPRPQKDKSNDFLPTPDFTIPLYHRQESIKRGIPIVENSTTDRLFPNFIRGQEEQNSFMTFFKINTSRIDLEYHGNGAQYERLDVFLRDLLSQSNVEIDSIVVIGSASPEGDPLYNASLSRQRSASVANYLGRLYPQLDQQKFIEHSVGENWVGLLKAVKQDPNVPYKEEVVNILEISSSNRNREFFLRRLKDGKSWNYLSEHILPGLRGGISTKIYYTKGTILDSTEVTSTINSPSHSTFVKRPVMNHVTEIVPPTFSSALDTVFLSRVDTIKLTERYLDTIRFMGDSIARPVWAIKTNLLYWAALQPNIEFEFYFGKHWSLNFEYQFAWWKNSSKHQYYQYTHCGPEGRYWFKGDGQFKGHYVGLHVGFGIYDLSWGHQSQVYQGYQGEFGIALGISYGYTWQLGKYLHLEAGFGFGYIMTEYRRYNYLDECYVYQGMERMQFLGPTKARVALQWRLGTGLGKKKGGLK